MRWTGRVLVALVALTAAVYLVDWAIWRTRAATGKDGRGGLGTVSVTRFVVAEEKGSKEEYFPDGTDTVDCSQSLFPQAGAGACWWVQKHRVVFER